MIRYFELPQSFFSFLKPIELDRFSYDRPHIWITRNLEEIITDAGINWFKLAGIDLAPRAMIFRCDSNLIGPVHDDGIEFAFNWVLDGYGTMEWVSNINGTAVTQHLKGLTFTRYADVKSADVVDRWNGKVALVRINQAHRVVTEDSERYCLSIRALSPKTFDEALKLIYNRIDAEC